MTEIEDQPSPPPAKLDRTEGFGYATVESLHSLGKGKRCDGIFMSSRMSESTMLLSLATGEHLVFEGTVYHRHQSTQAEMRVRLTQVASKNGEVVVEFTAESPF